MKLDQWIEYPTMSIAIQKIDNGFRCFKYVDGNVVRGTSAEFEDIAGLSEFLNSLPNADKADINSVIEQLKF
ncbi:MAG: hypothetical protein MK105_18000 [Crocinitomicaceae bacterium]|nr:hypothetical protein [Crocinitomicaceae bacterium]